MNYSEKFKLKNKTAFVLGGSGLVGKEVSKALLDCGAKVVILDKINRLQKNQNKFNFEIIDVSKPINIEKNYKKIIKKHSIPDIFINCSYPRTTDWSKNSFSQINYKSFKKNIEIHLNSFSWIAKIVAESMKSKKKGGSIIQLSSIYGVVGQDLTIYEGTKMKESMTYSIIKGGINNLTRLMASYYGRDNIRVNVLCAGGVFDNQNKKFVKKYNKKTPLKRMAKADEIASSAVFLASDAASYITGSLFMVDGGWTAI